jgi:hypothetical protein
MKPWVVAFSLLLAALGAGAEAASLPKPVTLNEKQPIPVMRRTPRAKLPQAPPTDQRARYRHLGPTHVNRP